MKVDPDENRPCKEVLENSRRIENALRSALKLNQYVQTASEDEIMQYCIEECETLTRSQIGFFHFVNPDQETIHLYAWSHNTTQTCNVPGYQPHYPTSKAGVWVDCLHQRKPVVHNDYPSMPHKKGMPDGHVAITRGAYVPIFEKDQIVAIIGVGNKETDYDQTDLDQLQLLAENVWFSIRRKRYELERENLLKELNAINSELQSIVYVTSHDLRSPLFNLEGFSNELDECCRQMQKLIDDKYIPLPVRQNFNDLVNRDFLPSLQYIRASTMKMRSVIDGLLRVSRVGTSTLNIQPLDMRELVKMVLVATEYPLQQMGITVAVPKLPPCMGDRNQINQVFTNLIDNAIKYRDPQRELSIRITGRVENNMSLYRIEDNGVGIRENRLEKIFELFFRQDPDSDVEGEGLGLTIVHRILDRNKGRISVESKPGQGSTFTVALPTVPTTPKRAGTA